jgi:ligand-binding sensor domain-containing protein
MKSLSISKIVFVAFAFLISSSLSAQTLKGQWMRTNGLITSQINTIDTLEQNLFACTQSGLYVTSDSGADWEPDSAGMGSVSVSSVIANDGKLFAGTNGKGIFVSSNNGASWSATNSGLVYVVFGDTTRLALNVYTLAQANGMLFTGTQATVFVSTNNGVSWRNPAYGAQSVGALSLVMIGTNLIAGTSNGIYYSPDSGRDWYAVLNVPVSLTIISGFAVLGSTIFVGTGSDGVWSSTDSGMDWAEANDSGLTDANVTTLLVSGKTLFAGTESGGVFVSSDSGVTWEQIDSGLNVDTEITSLAIKDSTLYAGTSDSGIWRHSLLKIVTAPSSVASPSVSETSISVYPNPAMSSINITSSTGPFSMLDPLGRSYEIKQTGNTLDISALPPGVYFVSDGHSRVKFVKE